MIAYRCDGKGCDAETRDKIDASWVSITPRRGIGEDKSIVGTGTLHFCAHCWTRLCAVIGAGHPI
jgi:hypothetical protein